MTVAGRNEKRERKEIMERPASKCFYIQFVMLIMFLPKTQS